MIQPAMLLAALASEAPSQDLIPAFFTGERILEICNQGLPGQCSMYVAGVVDGIFVSQGDTGEGRLCPGQITNRSAADRVVRFLQAHEEMRAKAAAVVVREALKEQLACTSEAATQQILSPR